MHTKFTPFLLLLSACASLAGQASAQETRPANAAAPDAEQIEQWINQLGDEKFELREAASQSLAKLGNRARPALERTTNNIDAEISSRAKAILDRLPKRTHTIVDALGQPIPLAAVTIQYAHKKQSLEGGPAAETELPPVVASVSEEDGGIAVPPIAADQGVPGEAPRLGFSMSAVVQHADYGQARIDLNAPGENTVLQLPLVRRGTEARARALTGQVVSKGGEPVAGAVIECFDIRTPGEGLIEGSYPRGEALSDDEGRFAYYLPPSETRRSQRGALTPANSRYGIRVTVPGNDSYFPWTGRYSNAVPARIELPLVARFHRFRFEAAGGGWISDPKQLQQVRVQFDSRQAGERMLTDLGPGVATSGHKLLAGTYVAECFVSGKRIEYLPLAVTDDSPEELTFSLPHAVTYRGRVVHGITGEPLPGALLMGWNSTSRNNLALLSAEDWKLLSEVPSNPPLDHPAIQRLREFYGVQGLVRADREGRFEITRKPDQDFYGLLAFDENSIPFKIRVVGLKPDKQHRIDAGEFPLFPAAKMLVRPVFTGERLAVSPRWLPEDAGQPDWFERFQTLTRSSEREFEYVHWLALNESQPVFVPAGIRLRVRFETPYDDQWAGAIVESVHLEPGAAKDFGDLRFPANLPVAVRVVDRQGNPVEGVPVRQKDLSDNAWSVAHNTDREGLAKFYAPPNTEGQFWVSDLPGPEAVRLAENLKTRFTVGGAAPQEPVTITITDVQAELLFGAGKAR